MRPAFTSTEGCPEGAIETHSGVLFSVVAPKPGDVRLEDLAHQLANVCRFQGACDPFYSVAEHSVLVHDLVALETGSKKLRLGALFHDAHEAYLGDAASPIKKLFQPLWGELAAGIDVLVAELIGIKPELLKDPLVKQMDDRAMVIEAARIKHGPHWEWAKSDPLALLPEGLVYDRSHWDWRPRNPGAAFLGRAAALDVFTSTSNHGGVTS